MRRKNEYRSIDAINKIQYKNLISSLSRLVLEKSEKIVHLEKVKRLLKFPTRLLTRNISIGIF